MVNLVTDENKFLKSKVLYDVGDTFKELYYIYRDKYKNGMNTKSKQKFDYKKIETHSLIIRKILKRKKKTTTADQ